MFLDEITENYNTIIEFSEYQLLESLLESQENYQLTEELLKTENLPDYIQRNLNTFNIDKKSIDKPLQKLLKKRKVKYSDLKELKKYVRTIDLNYCIRQNWVTDSQIRSVPFRSKKLMKLTEEIIQQKKVEEDREKELNKKEEPKPGDKPENPGEESSGPVNTGKIKSDIKNKMMEKKGVLSDPKVSESKKQKTLVDIIKECILDVKISDMKESAIILLYVVILSTVAATLCMLILGPGIGTVVYSILCAPIIEEWGKNLAIEKKVTGTYVLMFNVVEFSMFVFSGVSPVLRMLPLIMHYVTTIMQKYIIEKKVSVFGSDPKHTALVTGTVLHMVWNVFAVLFNPSFRMKG